MCKLIETLLDIIVPSRRPEPANVNDDFDKEIREFSMPKVHPLEYNNDEYDYGHNVPRTPEYPEDE